MFGHIFIEPYLDRHCKQYKSILTLNEIPAGPLAAQVVRILMPRVSEFGDYTTQKCTFALLGEDRRYLEAKDLPNLLGYMASNGYTIDYHMSKLLQGFTPGRIVCSFNYI